MFMEKEDIFEELRRKLVYSMKVGSVFCIHLDKMEPDFHNEWTDSAVFPLDQICDFDEWREDEKYMKIVKEEDKKTEADTLVEKYQMKDSHSIAFLAKYKSEETMLKVVKNIPESDMMQILVVEEINEEAEAAGARF